MAKRTDPRKRVKNNGSRSKQRAQTSKARTSRNIQRSLKQRSVRRKRQLFLFRLMCGLLICVVIVLAPTVFFRVSQVHMIEDTQYDAEEMIQTSGIQKGDNMLFLHSNNIKEKLKQAYPYVDTVTLKRKLPSTINIEVTERVASLSVERDGKYLLMDMSGKALEVVDKIAPKTVEVIGVKTDDVQVGHTISQKNKKMTAIMDLMGLMTQYGMNTKVRGIDMQKAFEVKMQYDDRYIILLGDLSDLEHKIQFLQAILKESSLPDSGIIDLTDDKEAHYRPGDVNTFKDEKKKEEPEEPTDEKTEEQVPEAENTPSEPTEQVPQKPEETSPDDTSKTEEDSVPEEQKTENTSEPEARNT